MLSVKLPSLLGKLIWKAKWLVEINTGEYGKNIIASFPGSLTLGSFFLVKQMIWNCVWQEPYLRRPNEQGSRRCNVVIAWTQLLAKDTQEFLGKASDKRTAQGLVRTIKFQTIIQSACRLKFHFHSDNWWFCQTVHNVPGALQQCR